MDPFGVFARTGWHLPCPFGPPSNGVVLEKGDVSESAARPSARLRRTRLAFSWRDLREAKADERRKTKKVL